MRGKCLLLNLVIFKLSFFVFTEKKKKDKFVHFIAD